MRRAGTAAAWAGERYHDFLAVYTPGYGESFLRPQQSMQLGPLVWDASTRADATVPNDCMLHYMTTALFSPAYQEVQFNYSQVVTISKARKALTLLKRCTSVATGVFCHEPLLQ